MDKYLTLTRGNQAPGVVKPVIEGNINFKIKSQFMRELREDTFAGNKKDDAQEHVELILDIVSLFNILGVTRDVIMLRVFPITLTRAAKRWGLIPGMAPARALTAIQTMTDHSQKWHDGSCSKNISNSGNSDGIAAIVSKLDNLGRDMKKLKENVDALQLGCQLCGGGGEKTPLISTRKCPL
ncbi:hypothetical protein Tco_1292048 [Tanacetum coccineum]